MLNTMECKKSRKEKQKMVKNQVFGSKIGQKVWFWWMLPQKSIFEKNEQKCNSCKWPQMFRTECRVEWHKKPREKSFYETNRMDQGVEFWAKRRKKLRKRVKKRTAKEIGQTNQDQNASESTLGCDKENGTSKKCTRKEEEWNGNVQSGPRSPKALF